MAKFETICCAMTWGLMNALFIAVAIGSAAPTNSLTSTQIAETSHGAPAVTA